jgi:hypothetical protein
MPASVLELDARIRALEREGCASKHDRVAREQLRRFRGNDVNTTGDGFVASFDGPARAVPCAQAISGAIRDLGTNFG